jgi:uncharacterized membrane protein YbjE (DUF340 family)
MLKFISKLLLKVKKMFKIKDETKEKLKLLRFLVYLLFIIIGFSMSVFAINFVEYDRSIQFIAALGYFVTLFSVMPILLLETKEYYMKGK